MGDESGEIALSLWSTGMIRLLRVGADWCPCSGPGGSEDERVHMRPFECLPPSTMAEPLSLQPTRQCVVCVW